VRLESDECRLSAVGRGSGDGATDDIDVTEMNTVEASDGDGGRPDGARREPQMN
jgi:hypothetical protein